MPGPSNAYLPTAGPLALYVHIPFCETKCPYCDFNTYAGIEALIPAYVDALAHEIAQWGALLGRPELGSVFFGGGTPSYLPANDLLRLTGAIVDTFRLASGAEMTLEANPGDVTPEGATEWLRAGFNRVSIGVQSLDDGELLLLGRRHTAEQARGAVAVARRAGFGDLSVDLMFGLPHQSLATWERTLDGALALTPDHLSLYALTLEMETPMDVDVRSGRLPEPDPDLGAEMYQLAQSRLEGAGYGQYEISNWARPGHASRHNLTYWHNRPYLGVGPGAHSYLLPSALPAGDLPSAALGRHGARFAVMRSPRGYIGRALQWGESRATPAPDLLRNVPFLESVEVLDAATAMAETMIMGLRLNEGMDDASFRLRFGRSITEAFPEAVAECLELGLLEWEAGWLRLAEAGRLLGNEAFQRFVAKLG